jgi:thymidylate synthase (FAD)
MSKVDIKIYKIAETRLCRDEARKWLDDKGVAKNFELPEGATEADILIGLAGKRCYNSFPAEGSGYLNPNITKIRYDWAEYIDNILASGHGSVLEHVSFTFAIENVSRVFTSEMNRHRVGWAISEGSLRYIRFGVDVPYWEPKLIQGPDVLGKPEQIALGEYSYEILLDILQGHDGQKMELETLDHKKEASRILFERHFDNMRLWYTLLEIIWKDELSPSSKFKQKKELTSLFRRGIGMGCATGGIWTGNVRALRHVLTMRCSVAAEEEIAYVFSTIAKMMVEEQPALFGDFKQDESGYWAPTYVKV